VNTAAVLAALTGALEAQGLVVLVDQPRAPLPSVEILPPGFDQFHEMNESWDDVRRSLWLLRLYSEPTFPAAVDLVDTTLGALRADVTLGGVVAYVLPARVDAPRKDSTDTNNQTRYIREMVLAIEHNP